jgi:2,3-bisphosphoglycerate-independent phosphoglycerate mutase
MKYILVIGDGIADNPLPELDGKTPIEAAHIPVIDRLANCGEVGSVRTVPPGFPPGSDTATLPIFGADPRICYTGRAPLEAAGFGVTLEAGEVAYRCNMVALEEKDIPFPSLKILSHNAGSIEGSESFELGSALTANPEFKAAMDAAGLRLHLTPSFRHIGVQRDADLNKIVLTPPHDVRHQPIGPNLPRGNRTAASLYSLMELAHRILSRHPVNEARRAAGKLPGNGIWFWAEGTAVVLDSFTKRYGKTGALISGVPLLHGIARLCGLDVILVEGATGELDTNYQGKVDAALTALRSDYDFVTVHLEAPDECTHNNDLKGKLQAIEWLDSRIVAPLLEGLDGVDYRLLLLSDHKTLMSTLTHDASPVPFLLYDSKRRSGGSGLPFSEKSGEQGIFLDSALKLMPLLFSR